MTTVLPDVCRTETTPILRSLNWVGMQGIALPITLTEPAYQKYVTARADLQVDLPLPHVKGIHMSRLYLLLDNSFGSGTELTPAALRELLQAMVDTHNDCGTTSARIKINFDLLLRRSALLTEGKGGWKAYPVTLEASLIGDVFKLRTQVTVEYSSTCPCSAALTRQLVEQSFLNDFEGQTDVELTKVSEWLSERATLATPHSQRSEAVVSVDADQTNGAELGLLQLIKDIEEAVATPVQTAVKRADEQAFAALNGQNLMFVEDAARQIGTALENYTSPEVYVRHMESLHAHDAVAWSTS
ncbi:MAG: GTP cyclohydrolase FolE2 [Pseudomonadota bacterium]